jgi:hypothetical protein
MSELERALRELDVAWPETPDVAGAVRARLDAPPRWRARFAIAVAALALLVGGTLAVPEARSTVFRWLGLKSVEIKHAPPPPPRSTVGATLGLGRPVTLDRARRDGPVLVPAVLGEPAAVYEMTLPTGTTAISLVYKPELLVQSFKASVEPFIQKTIAGTTRAQKLTIGPASAYWLTGAHGFAYTVNGATDFESQRIADRTLLVERPDGVLLRIEGKLTRARAVAIARSVQ